MVRKPAITELMPNFSGHVIDNGRLKLLDCLGSGAYGKVYRGVDTTSPKAQKKYYAVKCLCRPKPGSRQDEFQKRELAIHQLLDAHPNVVQLHKVLSDEFFVYVVLDLYAGGDLFTAITEHEAFLKDNDLVKRTFVQIIDAVHYCHEKGVFHRDIKPENILSSEDGSRVCLADFGLSTMDAACSDFGCGSSYYMSPECIGQEIRCGYSTRHSDIWSLGVILANMISGRNPWRYATTKDECFAAYLHDNDYLLRVLPISDGANNILKKIFNLNPLCRISLPDLRQEILGLDTFFLTETPLINKVDSPTPCNNLVIATTSVNKPPSSRETTRGSSLSSEEQYHFRSPQVDEYITSTAVLPASCLEQFIVASYSASDDKTITPESVDTSSASSGPESQGPVTPVTIAVDPKIYAPDKTDGSVSPISVTSSEITSSSGSTKVFNKLRKPFAKRTALFRLAVTRLTGLVPGEESK